MCKLVQKGVAYGPRLSLRLGMKHPRLGMKHPVKDMIYIM